MDRGSGIGFGGPVRANRPLRSEHVAGWDRVDLCAEIRRRYGWDCRIENDGLAGMFVGGGEKTYQGMIIGDEDSDFCQAHRTPLFPMGGLALGPLQVQDLAPLPSLGQKRRPRRLALLRW